jgi:hypothetical protein
MREDIPEWLGKPPVRGSIEWEAWLEKWRDYARRELKDSAADDPDFDFGLLSVEERWRVALMLNIKEKINAGRNGESPQLPSGRATSDLAHASLVAWQVGRSIRSNEVDATSTEVDEWIAKRMNPKRRRLAHGIRYGFLDGLGSEAIAPSWSSPDYVAAYEAAWLIGNSIAIESDPR